ncbi:MAG: hypothetical protein RR585_08270, partial [Coprobacillus sp.]
ILASGVYITLSNVDSITTMMAQSSNTAAQAGSVSGAFVAMLQQAQLPVWIIDFLTASVDKISTIVLMSAIPIVINLYFRSIIYGRCNKMGSFLENLITNGKSTYFSFSNICYY